MCYFPLDRERLGRLIRSCRKERSLRLKDLQDENISSATISSVERGMKNISFEKITYLCGKLDLDVDQFSVFVEVEEKREMKLRNQLNFIEHSMDLFGPDQGLDQLRSFKIDRKSRWLAQYTYLKGRCYFLKQNWEKAKRQLQSTLDLLEAGTDLESTNIKAACQYLFAKIAMEEHSDIILAQNWIDLGSQSFVQGGDRGEICYELLLLKAKVYMGQEDWEKALGIVNELWESLDQVTNPHLKVDLYRLKAFFWCKQGYIAEATSAVFQGLELAKMCMWREGAVDLLHVLSKIYIEEGDFESAEKVLLQASTHKEKHSHEYRMIQTYLSLGNLYNNQERWSEAEGWLRDAVRKAKNLTNKIYYVMALEALGDCEKGKGEEGEALRTYQSALEQAERHGFVPQSKTSLMKVIQCQEVLKQELTFRDLERLYRIVSQEKRELLTTV
ncbi:Tetratricopeptide repeat-containing protein [Thermoactinomyces sp. DSM 45891]|uniref:helix-turn-helix domain-containing protein n=1 Tax=Thermoactinomyces sp. DSM 45891 TaxID=1761907 RepID=UPI0009203CF8|nr:helix-turn-helix domain-containing protein [Thermoactinomyces sp. DSM 45891]SFW98985.1 Tetratricopeptide repeat-containing protein [Thermoactinomyces sp. DSM 45891]